jgi:hypothetical protein
LAETAQSFHARRTHRNFFHAGAERYAAPPRIRGGAAYRPGVDFPRYKQDVEFNSDFDRANGFLRRTL